MSLEEIITRDCFTILEQRFYGDGLALKALQETGTKEPEQKMTHLLDMIWFQYVEQIWNERNDIMHNQENFYSYSQEENNEWGTQIRWYVKHRAEVLKHGD